MDYVIDYGYRYGYRIIQDSCNSSIRAIRDEKVSGSKYTFNISMLIERDHTAKEFLKCSN